MIEPAFVMVATVVLDDDQTPPVVGVTEVVLSMQIALAPVKVATGLGLTVTVIVLEKQPVTVSVQTRLEVPSEIPVIKPSFVIVATGVLEEAHVPPEVGVTEVVCVIQILLGPVNDTIGFW